MNQGGSVLTRFDYQPFGEEIGAGVGQRTTSQGYGGSDSSRQRYALTERDEATGLDHTWWRKYEQSAGRWTSPDPFGGSMDISNPQSFNRYAYVGNDPINFVDPNGLQGSPFQDGINEARARLQKPLCRNLFGNTNPIALLNRLLKDGNIRYNSLKPTNIEVHTLGKKVTKVSISATAPIGDEYAVTTPFSGKLKNGLFYSITYITVNSSSSYATGVTLDGIDITTVGFQDGLTLLQLRGLVIIHELLHVAKAIPSDNNNASQSHRNSVLVKWFCFPETIGKSNGPIQPGDSPINNTFTPRPLSPLPPSRPSSGALNTFRILDILFQRTGVDVTVIYGDIFEEPPNAN